MLQNPGMKQINFQSVEPLNPHKAMAGFNVKGPSKTGNSPSPSAHTNIIIVLYPVAVTC